MEGERQSVSDFETFYLVPTIETMKSSLYSPHYEKLRAWLKRCREEGDLTLREASEIAGRHHSILGKMEQNSRKIEIIEFVHYCRALGVDPHEGLEVIIQSIEADVSQVK